VSGQSQGRPETRGTRGAASPAVERFLAVVVALCVTLLLVGIALSLLSGNGLPHKVVAAGDLASGLSRRSPAAFLSLGLLTLLALPLLRIGGSLLLFARERDWRYVMVVAGLCGIIAASVLVGQA
jgi:uncharacterized membrane protein